MTYFTGAARQAGAVPTVAALRLFEPVANFVDGMMSKVAGGSLYEWSSSSGASDNGTSIIKPTSVSGNGRWLLIAGGGGTQGFQGAQGGAGLQGAQGGAGTTGSQGNQGNQGAQGANELPVGNALLTFNTSAGTADAVGYTVPSSPAGPGRFVATFIIVRLETAITGAGNVVVRAGTTVGGNDILLDSAAWTSATTVGTSIGIAVGDRGSALLSTNGYTLPMAASATVNVRATTATGITGGAARVYVYGFKLTP